MPHVLHVVGELSRGGSETWLMNVLRNIGQTELKMDFLTHQASPGIYDDEARSLGAKILFCPGVENPARYAKSFRRLADEHGPYDIVHSHVHHFSGYVLWLARRAGIRGRVAHSHLDTRGVDARAGLLRRGYLALMTRLIRENATARLACSRPAAAALYGEDWAEVRNGRPAARVHYCSCDLEQFRRPTDRQAARRELGVPDRAFVVGHVGRFDPQKNHAFLLDVARALLDHEPRALFLLVGDGPLRARMEERAARLGLGDRVRFLGSRGDVPRLMTAVMDAFVFPSLFEGLGMVLVEAQAAGLPCVLSDAVPREADVVPGLPRRLGLDESAEDWAEALLETRGRRLPPAEATRVVSATPFDLTRGVEDLRRVYRECVRDEDGRARGGRESVGAGRARSSGDDRASDRDGFVRDAVASDRSEPGAADAPKRRALSDADAKSNGPASRAQTARGGA